MITNTKKCTVCKIIKSYDEYYIRPNGKPYSQCNPCKVESKKKWYQKDKLDTKKNDLTEKICPNCKICKSRDSYYSLKQGGQLSTYCKECELSKYNRGNKSVQETKQKWRKNNPEKIKKYNLKYHHEVRKHNINYVIIQNVRSRIHNALNCKKDLHTIKYLGCSVEYFKKWFEFQFSSVMSWDNYGSYWEIDHVKPCASFDLTNKNSQLECFNWKNCSPLKIELNRSKKDKIFDQTIFEQTLKVLQFKKLICNKSKLRELPKVLTTTPPGN